MPEANRYVTGDDTNLDAVVAELKRRVSALERLSQMGSTSIDRGTFIIKEGDLQIVDNEGNLRVQAGKLSDGTYDIAAVDDSGTLVKLAALAFGLTANSITTSESTASASYTDLTTVGPAVTTDIGASGRCLVTVGAFIEASVPRGSAIDSAGGYMSFAVAGPTASSANEIRRIGIFLKYDKTGPVEDTAYDIQYSGSRVTLLTGLTAGVYTFTAKYKADTGHSTTFSQRLISVQPF